ncbi:unnamed protein product, partial [Strongylus vulgaris]
MPLEGFKIPGSFLKRKIEQEHVESNDTAYQGAAPIRRTEFPSSRLFGNLTRGGPTSVQNPSRGEGVRFAFSKTKDRRFANALQDASLASTSDRSHDSAENQSESINKYKLVRKVERNSKSPARQQPE